MLLIKKNKEANRIQKPFFHINTTKLSSNNKIKRFFLPESIDSETILEETILTPQSVEKLIKSMQHVEQTQCMRTRKVFQYSFFRTL